MYDKHHEGNDPTHNKYDNNLAHIRDESNIIHTNSELTLTKWT